jgi:transcriptional regulator with GAF, ATPase, and Fis domain
MITSERPPQLLIDVWRTAAQSLPLNDALARLAGVLGRVLPADYIAVRQLDRAARRIETIAVAALRPCGLPPLMRDGLSDGDFEMLAHWCRAGSVASSTNGADPSLVRLAAPRPLHASSEVLIVPLRGANNILGVAVLVTRTRGRLGAAHEVLASDLMAPLTVALEHDLRLKEFSRQREALEADKRALLQRLERQDLAETIVGRESGLQLVMERIEQAAPTDVPILLLGEPGTGKEVLARAIHGRSKRGSGPFVRVNCAAVPAGLVACELFGQEKATFNGAAGSRKGWFERADGGTLFLDEIAELSLDAQTRLSRILQDGTFERVGGQRSLSVDVRVVAATHRNLREMVGRGTFREDLWNRIGVFPADVPPLRARREDIPALAAHFALRVGMRIGGTPLALSSADIDMLLAYAWPGNVRELAAVVERAAILGNGKQLRVAEALGSSNVAKASSSAANGSTARGAHRSEDPASVATLDDAMRCHIERALAATNGRIEGARGAASLLRINPHTLRARMRKLHIDWTQFRQHESALAGDPHWE